jgi:trimeric autotransporter adhesin
MVRDFKPNAADGSYSFMKMFGDKLFFIADTSATAAECYYTQNGNTPVKMSSIDPSKGLSNFYPIAVSGGNLYFSAFDPIVGYELFKTNGSSFTLIKDIYTVNYSMDYTFFRQSVVLNNKLFFTAVDGKAGNEIWSTDGKSNQTKMPFEIYRYPTEEGLTNYSTTYHHYQTSTPIERIYKINSKILIFEGRNIWSSDGTSNPQLIFSANNYFSYLNSGLEMNGYLYFDMGNKLYRTDGTAAGTTLMCVPDGTLPNDSRAIKLMDVVDNKVFFAGFHSTYGWEVFSNDGTVGVAVLLMDLTPGYNTTELFHASKTVGNKMYFSIYTATNGIVLYVTQGTSANTTLLKVFGFSTQGPLFMTNFNNTHLVFNGEEGTTGRELWKSDGTPTGTVMIKDIHPTAGSNPRNDLYNKQFAVYNNYVFFGATNATTSGLYRSDLTAAGTEYLSQYEGFTALSTPHGVYMYGYSPATGNEPYKVEFDAASRRLVSDIYPGTYTSNPYDFHLLGDLIFVHTFDTQQKKQIHVFRTCLNTTQLAGNQNSSATTYAMDQVRSTANLGASTSQIFSAGKSILLEPGFKTNAQTVFETKLEGCFYSTQN